MNTSRRICRLAGIGVILVAGLCLVWAEEPPPQETRSLLERDPDGWHDLMPDEKFSDWKRIVLPPEMELRKASPWSVNRQTGTLVCDGEQAKEMLLHRTQRLDGVLHIEWRFVKKEGMPEYNSGVYVRCSPDGKIWHQVQVAHTGKAPMMGDLFGETLADGKLTRVVKTGVGHKLVKPPGEWNTYEITCTGKVISVWINGRTAIEWKDCPVTAGLLGVQAEYHDIEFRNIKYRPFN